MDLLPMGGGLFLKEATTQKDRQRVFQMRYRAYHNIGAVEAHQEGTFTDLQDTHPSCRLFMVLDREHTPVASTRTLFAQPGSWDTLTSSAVFSEGMRQHIPHNYGLVEVTRMVVDPLFPQSRQVVFALFKAHFLRIVLEEADGFIAAFREEHAELYSRMFGMAPIGPYVPYPGLQVKMTLMYGDARNHLGGVLDRWPQFKASPEDLQWLGGARKGERSENAGP